MEITITKTTSPKPPERGWFDARIVPYAPFAMDPAAGVFHSGQAMFEGSKAFRCADGRIHLSRPEQHAKRMAIGAPRLCMPSPSEADITMNVCFPFGKTLVTPPQGDSILAGVTRDSGFTVEDRPISIKEIRSAHQSGKLSEVFGTGTAAVLSPVGEHAFTGEKLVINEGKPGPVAEKLYADIGAIQRGTKPDTHGSLKARAILVIGCLAAFTSYAEDDGGFARGDIVKFLMATPDGGPPTGQGGFGVRGAGAPSDSVTGPVAPQESSTKSVVVMGSLDKNIIRAEVVRHFPEVRACAGGDASTVSGRVVVKFVIAASGAVGQASLNTSTTKAPHVDECVVKTVKSMSFPAPKGGGVVIVSYPFVFPR